MTSEARRRPLHAGKAPEGSSPARHASREGSANGAKNASRNGSRAAATNASGNGSRAAAPNGSSYRSPYGSLNGSVPDTTSKDGRATNRQTATNGHRSGNGRSPKEKPAPTSLIQHDPLAALVDEAQAAVSEGANALRDVRERYRSAYVDRIGDWERLRTQTAATRGGSQADSDEAMIGREVNQERSTLDRIDLAVKSLENAWLFLAREDTSLVLDPTGPPSAADAQMRIVEAQEAERTRLAREIHDGPAQALANAIFQVELVQRLLDRDEQQARAELGHLKNLLSRELRGVRAYLSQLRPPLLADLGLSGAIAEAADQVSTALGVPVHLELEDGVDTLPETVEVVTLRIIQEALQNARKHGQPSEIRVRMARDPAGWVVEVRDDGRGFDTDEPPLGGRRHFGLQFMRERAELIGARFEVRSSPNLGTAVRMTIPPGAMGMPIPGSES
jgi:two-component system, NarL family, sensor histidine kinase DegS